MDEPVVTERSVSAGGNIASARFAMSEPDGGTLLRAGSGSMGIDRSLDDQVACDPQTEMAPSWPPS